MDQEQQQTQQQKPALRKPFFITMESLGPVQRVNMHLKVQSVKVIKERRRYEGSVNRVAECLVGDQHGCAILIARDEQLDVVKEGAVITIRNAHSVVVNEHLRIEVDRWGKVEASKENVSKIELSNNLSDVEYELVTVSK